MKFIPLFKYRYKLAYAALILVIAGFFYMLGSIKPTEGASKKNEYPFLAPRLFAKESNDKIINFTQRAIVFTSIIFFKFVLSGVLFSFLTFQNTTSKNI